MYKNLNTEDYCRTTEGWMKALQPVTTIDHISVDCSCYDGISFYGTGCGYCRCYNCTSCHEHDAVRFKKAVNEILCTNTGCIYPRWYPKRIKVPCICDNDGNVLITRGVSYTCSKKCMKQRISQQ